MDNPLNILYVGDIMGETGMQTLEQALPGVIKHYNVDLVVAQAENVTEGKGISLSDFARLKRAGVDFCTGGNWTLHLDETTQALNDPNQPIIRPANYPDGTPGLGYKYIDTAKGKVLVVSLLGQIVGKDADRAINNPLQVIDRILDQESQTERAATIVNFHGDYSSEKVVIGHYLDGKVTAVLGDHWHVPTADARVLPGGTAHMTDVGMCGVLNSSLGVTYGSVLPRWRDGKHTRNHLETEGPRQLNAALITVSEAGLASKIEHIQQIL